MCIPLRFSNLCYQLSSRTLYINEEKSDIIVIPSTNKETTSERDYLMYSTSGKLGFESIYVSNLQRSILHICFGENQAFEGPA